MRKLNLILQEVLKFVLVFLFAFVWLRYFTRSLLISLVFSFLIAAICYAVQWFYARRKAVKSQMKLQEKEDAQNMFVSLCLQDDAMSFFEKLAKKKHENVAKKKDYIVITHQEKVKTLLYADLTMQALTIPRFMDIYHKVKKEKATKIVVCCKEIGDKMLMSFLNNFKEKIVILDEYEAYSKLYKYYDFFPEITNVVVKEKKMVFKEFLAYSFNKKRVKGYLFSAVILIISGLFIPMTIYYCLIASILVVFALVSQFNPHYNKKVEGEVI